jgi:hypothetical protein
VGRQSNVIFLLREPMQITAMTYLLVASHSADNPDKRIMRRTSASRPFSAVQHVLPCKAYHRRCTHLEARARRTHEWSSGGCRTAWRCASEMPACQRSPTLGSASYGRDCAGAWWIRFSPAAQVEPERDERLARRSGPLRLVPGTLYSSPDRFKEVNLVLIAG